MNIYIFDIGVASIARQQRVLIRQRENARDVQAVTEWRREMSIAREKGVPFDRPIPTTGYPLTLSDDEYNQLPLSRAVQEHQQYIGCHKARSPL